MENEKRFTRDLIQGTSKHNFMVALKRLKYVEQVQHGEYQLSVPVSDKVIDRAYKMYTAVGIEYQS
jgi:hypothetical protein